MLLKFEIEYFDYCFIVMFDIMEFGCVVVVDW